MALFRMPCTVYLYGSEVLHTWSYEENCLAFISLKSVTGLFWQLLFYNLFMSKWKKKTYSDIQRNLHFTLLFCSLLYSIYLFWFRLLYIMNIITTVIVYPFWQCEVKENTDHNYSLSVRCILSLCCSVSDNCTFFF